MDYTNLITSQHKDKPAFLAVIQAITQPLQELQGLMQEMSAHYDIDTAAGAQLDVVGQWVGLDRRLTTPIDNVFFSWDTPGKGWDEGYWKGPFVPVEGVAFLDDSSYRAALRLKVAVNHWSGQNQSYLALPVKLEGTSGNLLALRDFQDMSMQVIILGLQPSLFFRTVLEQQGLAPKPLGVRITGYDYRNVPVYGHDANNTLYGGLDRGVYTI